MKKLRKLDFTELNKLEMKNVFGGTDPNMDCVTWSETEHPTTWEEWTWAYDGTLGKSWDSYDDSNSTSDAPEDYT